jgi:hypothetical protein
MAQIIDATRTLRASIVPIIIPTINPGLCEEVFEGLGLPGRRGDRTDVDITELPVVVSVDVDDASAEFTAGAVVVGLWAVEDLSVCCEDCVDCVVEDDTVRNSRLEGEDTEVDAEEVEEPEDSTVPIKVVVIINWIDSVEPFFEVPDVEIEIVNSELGSRPCWNEVTFSDSKPV